MRHNLLYAFWLIIIELCCFVFSSTSAWLPIRMSAVHAVEPIPAICQKHPEVSL